MVRVLETRFSGALLTAGMGHMPFRDIPDFLVDRGRALVAAGSRGPRARGGR